MAPLAFPPVRARSGLGSRCAACGGGDLAPYLRVAGEPGPDGLIPTSDRIGTALADVVRCRACGHGQLSRPPSAGDLSRAYAEAESEDYLAEERGQRATARAMLETIERFAGPGRLLDLGCWVGFLLAEARERGWETLGVEPSEFASRHARERLGLDVRTAELAAVDLGEAGFDAVFLGDVIEHLPDPEAELERIARLLAPGGVLAMALPDAGSRLARLMGSRWWSVIPTHVHYFTRRSVKQLLERGGYRPLVVRTAPKAFTVGYYLGRVAGYSRGLSAALVGIADALGLADRLVAPDFRDRMLVVARAPEGGG